jgi:1-acyl-sn-glycerol-3-phosphate acyltransferase
MNALSLERKQHDPVTVRRIISRLEKERAVVLFPEGQVRRPEDSMLKTGEFGGGIIRIARLARAPIIPCVLLGTGVFARASAWWPPGRARYGLAFGEPIRPAAGQDHRRDDQRALKQLRQAYAELYRELSQTSGLDIWSQPWRQSPAQSG